MPPCCGCWPPTVHYPLAQKEPTNHLQTLALLDTNQTNLHDHQPTPLTCSSLAFRNMPQQCPLEMPGSILNGSSCGTLELVFPSHITEDIKVQALVLMLLTNVQKPSSGIKVRRLGYILWVGPLLLDFFLPCIFLWDFSQHKKAMIKSFFLSAIARERQLVSYMGTTFLLHEVPLFALFLRALKYEILW